MFAPVHRRGCSQRVDGIRQRRTAGENRPRRLLREQVNREGQRLRGERGDGEGRNLRLPRAAALDEHADDVEERRDAVHRRVQVGGLR